MIVKSQMVVPAYFAFLSFCWLKQIVTINSPRRVKRTGGAYQKFTILVLGLEERQQELSVSQHRVNTILRQQERNIAA